MGHGLKYESYSDFSDYQQDPELKTFTDTVSDSQLEGFFMMLSFSLGSVVPILIYSFLPGVVNYVAATPDEHNILRLDHPPENTTLMMISLGVTMVVMFLLGAWKR
jgi:VIT1/CCC1 family predicted Fe2+/Mn2+ transporter